MARLDEKIIEAILAIEDETRIAIPLRALSARLDT
jgi:hypothetical protein